MKSKILVAALANLLLVGAVYADQFLTKADERNNVVSPGGSEVMGGGGSCGTAVAIAALPFSDSGTTVGGTNTNNALPGGCSDYTQVAGPDTIYTFTAGAGANIGITVAATTGAYDPAVYVLSTCGTSSTCVVGADATLAGGTETIPAQAFAPGTYGLYVDSFYGTGAASSGTFNLNVTGTLPVEVTNFSVD